MSDLSDKALERQQAKNSDRIQKEQETDKRSARVRDSVLKRYDPDLGRWEVQEGGSIIPNCRPITNATLSAGMPVVRKGQLIDQMRNRRKPVEEDVARRKQGNIMYAYVTTGDAPDSSALYVAGHKNLVAIKIDEWSNETITSGENIGEPAYVLGFCCLDNLGGGSFFISYTMIRIDGEGNIVNYTFKCVKGAAEPFSYTINQSELDSVGVGFNGEIGQLARFVGSVGFGNWLTNRIRDIAEQSSGGTTVTTSESIRVSDISINPNIGVIETRQSFTTVHVSTPIPGGGSATSMTGSYQAYLSPVFSVTAPHTYTGNNSGLFKTGRYYQSVRYNARLNKGIYSATEYDLDWLGMGLYRNGNVTTTPFMQSIGQSGSNTRLPVMTDYECTVSLTNNSTTAIVQSGVIPAIGTAISGINIRMGTYIVDVNGSTLTLSKTASGTATRTIFWGFPSTAGGTPPSPYTNGMRFAGSNLQCDIQSDGLSIIYLGDFVVRFGGAATLATERIKTPVSFYGDNFNYKRTDLVDLYPPGIIKKNAANQDLFLIVAASYHPG